MSFGILNLHPELLLSKRFESLNKFIEAGKKNRYIKFSKIYSSSCEFQTEFCLNMCLHNSDISVNKNS